MIPVLLHFAIGAVGGLAILFTLSRLSGESSASALFGVVILGVVCASIAHHVSPWGTPLVLSLYAAAGWMETRRDARLRAPGSGPAKRA